MIEEGGHATEGRLLLPFDFDLETDVGLRNAAEIDDVIEFCDEAYALSAEDGLTELHFVHAVVDEHLDVVDLDGVLPKVGEKREGQVAVYNGLAVRAFRGTLFIHVNPLVIQGCVGKEVDTFLIYLEPFGGSEFLAKIAGKFVVRVDD